VLRGVSWLPRAGARDPSLFSPAPGLMPLKSTLGTTFEASGTGYIGDSLKPNIEANRFIGKLRTAML
jgi:hypothetical protein